MAIVRKNGKAYDSGDVICTLFGIVEEEIAEISYSTNQEHQVNHSLSNRGTSWSRGKITDQGTITFYLNAISKLEKRSGGNLLDIAPFDINVTFVNEFNDIINDTVTCKFMSQGREITGQMGLTYQYALFVLDVKYNNA